MKRNEIYKILEQSDRWGVNSQPYLEEIADYLERVDKACGLVHLEVLSHASIAFRTRSPLTPSLAFELGLMMYDGEPESIRDDQTNFVLWWD